jgi:hypothetical protein
MKKTPKVSGFREKSAPYRAVVRNRKAMLARGIERFEVRALASDKGLIRGLAKKLAQDDEGAKKLRAALSGELGSRPRTGREIYEWLRASPLVGVDWYTERPFDPGRKIDL